MSKVIPLKPKQQNESSQEVEIHWGRFESAVGTMHIFAAQAGHKIEFTCKRSAFGRDISEHERAMHGINPNDKVWIVYARGFMTPGRFWGFVDSLFKTPRQLVIMREARRFVARVRRDVLWMDREQELNNVAMESLKSDDNTLCQPWYSKDW